MVTAPVKIFIRLKIDQCSSPQKSNIIFIRLLTITDFDLNVFLKYFNLLCTGVDPQIHTTSSVITNFNVYEDGNRNQKESTFQICNK